MGEIQGKYDGHQPDVNQAHAAYEAAASDVRFRCLTEVDNLFANRLPDGTYPPESLAHDLQNRITAVKEAAAPYAISESQHTVVEGVVDGRRHRAILWLGKTTMDAVDVAASGYDFHTHEAALRRVDVEIDEAEHAQAQLREGMAQILVSPRMTAADASYDVAKQEHLADDDALRVSWLSRDTETGQLVRNLQSILVRDIPLDGWVAWARSSHNLFGRALDIDDETSALGMMRAFSQMDVPLDAVPQGVTTILKDMLPHIEDPVARAKVNEHINRFEWANQQELDQHAVAIAERWQVFDIALSESRQQNRATFEVERFVFGLQNHWNAKDLALIAAHRLADGGLAMSRELEARIEQAQQVVLFASAGAVTGNTRVLAQLSAQEALQLIDTEHRIQALQRQGRIHDAQAVQARQSQMVARNNIRVGAGCPGEVGGDFGDGKRSDGTEKRPGDAENDADDAEDRSTWIYKKGMCRVESCATRPGQTEVGPCDVCRSCQILFDEGLDPTKFTVVGQEDPVENPKKRSFEIIWIPLENKEKTVVKVGKKALAEAA